MSKSTIATQAQETLFSRWLESIGAYEADSLETEATGFNPSLALDRDSCGETLATVGRYEIADCGSLYAFLGDSERPADVSDEEWILRPAVGYLDIYLMHGVEHVEMLAVHADHNGQGIGTSLMREFLRRNPHGKVGPVTPGCMAILRKIWREDVASGEK